MRACSVLASRDWQRYARSQAEPYQKHIYGDDVTTKLYTPKVAECKPTEPNIHEEALHGAWLAFGFWISAYVRLNYSRIIISLVLDLMTVLLLSIYINIMAIELVLFTVRMAYINNSD